jgi:tRNA(Leu) C34 or U34 (ribose-2'-O)-methylase TrmL
MEVTSKRVNRRVTNRRAHEEWYECARCGFDYPRHSVSVQNGLILCFGVNTTGCQDEPGHSANMRHIDIPRERTPESLPEVHEDL